MVLRVVPGENPELAPGMNTEVTIAVKTGFKNKLCVPLNAIFEKNGDSYVWIYQPEQGNVNSRKVTTGKLTGNNLITITTGLDAGDLVVAAGVHQIHENQKVEVLGEASESNVGGML